MKGPVSSSFPYSCQRMVPNGKDNQDTSLIKATIRIQDRKKTSMFKRSSDCLKGQVLNLKQICHLWPGLRVRTNSDLQDRFTWLPEADPLAVLWWIPQHSPCLCTNHVFPSRSTPPPWRILKSKVKK